MEESLSVKNQLKFTKPFQYNTGLQQTHKHKAIGPSGARITYPESLSSSTPTTTQTHIQFIALQVQPATPLCYSEP